MSGPLAATLDLHTDVLAEGARASLPATNRVLYVVEGDLAVAAAGQTASLASNSAWFGAVACAIRAGRRGARVLRFEVATGACTGPIAGEGIASRPALAATVAVAGADAHLLRCDRVDFPPGGIAYSHVHQGPGIRCLIAGAFRVDVNGASHAIAPGEAWFEAGPDPVYAQASEAGSAAFVRVMLLPRALAGRSSIRYLRPEDADKPKPQQYQVFIDEPIAL